MRRALHYILFESKSGLVGFTIVSAMVFMAVFADLLAPYSPYTFDLSKARMPPSLNHLLGTDELGRDLLSRIMHGARLTFIIALMSTLLAIGVGCLLGLIGGYCGGLVDMAISRLTDMMLSIPGLLLAILMVALWGGSVINIIVAIAYGQIPTFVRLVRSVTLQLKSTEFVIAARLLGLSTMRILFRHILPNMISIIIGNGTINIGFAILTASSLGFLGLGLDPSIPEWGAMIGSAKNYMTVAPHIILTVGFFIVLSILGFNLLGSALSDYLDPHRGVKK